ncbi:DUF1643 domain-containing protein [Paracoccus tegillarcae]|uniref:DUF1643 domain-containing protein n=1 Tax=Paracoccus tegillarcae TaxID=1529068 RepID=A0A2K9ERX1_9RHOB|nr:DUF1643 domain-containing protein [Paracoccus tegillarcae]AUH33556.1 hypothetical protein CUV01_09295 [Paracoccus tegillarcae]
MTSDSFEIRRHRADGKRSWAAYSPCGQYRYGLSRRWGSGPALLYVMLNPSTATEMANDPTIERCERRARALGFDGLGVVNLFAYRATRPEDLRRAADPVGPLNDDAIRAAALRADRVLCAWGVHGDHLGRAEQVRAALRGLRRPMLHLGLTKAGHPRHPLYVSYARSPADWYC